jgi:hypothetical protein
VGYYQQALEELIDHCLLDDSGGYTPSDFPAMGVDQQQLDALLEDFDNYNF